MDKMLYEYGQCNAHGRSTNLMSSNYTGTVTITTVLEDHQTWQLMWHEPRTNFMQR